MTGERVLRQHWRLRAGEAADFEWGFELHTATLREYVEQIWGWDPAVQRAMFSAAFNRQFRQVICIDDVDVGVLAVEHRIDRLYLELLELLPEWQCRGLGSDIIRWLREVADNADKPLSLHVLAVNDRAAALYVRQGLHVVAADDTRIFMSTNG